MIYKLILIKSDFNKLNIKDYFNFVFEFKVQYQSLKLFRENYSFINKY